MKLPMPDEYTVRLVDMDVREGGMISEDPDGHINVYINARLSSTGQHTAAYHEWEHWYNDDLNSDKDIQKIETRPDARKRPYLPPLMRAGELLEKSRAAARLSAAKRDDWQNDIYNRMDEY